MKAKRFGVDAPWVIAFLFLGALLSWAAGFAIDRWLVPKWPILIWLVWMQVVAGFVNLIMAVLMLRSSWIGKPQIVKEVVNRMWLQGDESILEVGCGQGIWMIEMAKKLTTGKVTGIDIWNTYDQSSNHLQQTLKNISEANVADRIDVKTADMCDLNFPPNTFDWVFASLSVHNIKSRDRRREALSAMTRVVKPEGRLVILDFQYINQYAEDLAELDWKEVTISPLQYACFPPVRILWAKK